MFQVTADARAELEARQQSDTGGKYIRLRMRDSCMLKVKVSFENEMLPNDTEYNQDGLRFIIDDHQLHFFRDKTLDYAVDSTGFKAFDVI